MRSLSLVVAGLLVPISFASAWGQVPLPTLRGIVLTAGGEGRAYFEDPQTGTLTGFTTRDTVGDCRIEEIQENRVILRRGGERVQMLLSVQSAGARVPSATSTAVSSSSATRWNPGDTPLIGNGQPWLDRLGIPPLALSRAIQSALPGLVSDNLDD